MRTLLVCVLLVWAAGPVDAAQQVKGRIEWLHRVEMRVVESGVVEEVPVTAGQHVEKGALLLRMDQRESKAKLLEAHARVARARVNTRDVERALHRARELFERGLIAQQEVDDAELEEAAAIAEEQSAQAAEIAAQVALERTELRAPFEGIVVATNVWAGDVIHHTLQSRPLIVISPREQMLARVLVTADVLRRYRPGQAAQVRVFGALRDAHVYSLGVEAIRVDPQGAGYELDLIFNSLPDELLRPSESIEAVLP